MTIKQSKSTSDNTRNIQFAEDPRREPHEKETTVTLDGDRGRAKVESFKKSVFAKLVQRPTFDIKRLNLLDADEQRQSVDSLDKVANSAAVIGVAGWLPVGALTIGVPRNSDSHADIVKLTPKR